MAVVSDVGGKIADWCSKETAVHMLLLDQCRSLEATVLRALHDAGMAVCAGASWVAASSSGYLCDMFLCIHACKGPDANRFQDVSCSASCHRCSRKSCDQVMR